VFRFGEQKHADTFREEFGGEPMHPKEKGRAKRWAEWKKGTNMAKPRKSLWLQLTKKFYILARILVHNRMNQFPKPGCLPYVENI
jgi:hypothetical protein